MEGDVLEEDEEAEISVELQVELAQLEKDAAHGQTPHRGLQSTSVSSGREKATAADHEPVSGQRVEHDVDALAASGPQHGCLEGGVARGADVVVGQT